MLPPPAAAMGGTAIFAHEEGAGEADGDLPIPVAERQIDHGAVGRGGGGIVDEAMEAAKGGEGRLHRRFGRSRRGHIAGERERRIADLRRRRLDPGFIEIEAGDPRPLGDEALGDGAADPLARTRHQDDPPGESGRHRLAHRRDLAHKRGASGRSQAR